MVCLSLNFDPIIFNILHYALIQACIRLVWPLFLQYLTEASFLLVLLGYFGPGKDSGDMDNPPLDYPSTVYSSRLSMYHSFPAPQLLLSK